MKPAKTKMPLVITFVALILYSCINDGATSQSQTDNSSAGESASSVNSISSATEEPVTATIEFGAKTHTEGSEATSSSYAASGVEVATIQYTACYGLARSDTYESSYALKMGSNKNKGSFTVNFLKSYVITSATVYASKYSGDTDPQYKFSTSANIDGTTLTIDDSSEKQYTFTNLNNGTAAASTSFTFASQSSGKSRIYVYKIKLTLNGSSISHSSSSSGQPSTSSSYDSHEPNIDQNGYYKGIDWNATGATLKTSLYNTISKNTKIIGYKGLWEAYKTTDVTSDGYIWDMYSNEKYVPGGSKQGNNYSKEGDSYNREHTIPQSIFGEASPMVCDIFHVVPTDGYVNNRRSNYPHGNVSSATYTSNNGSKLGTGNNNGYSGTVFEVIDEYKGDFARMYFYFVTRYQDKIPSYNYESFAKNTYPSLSSWAIKTYMAWNDKDPVSEKETARNEAAYKLQNNRNPFIDHPEAAHKIWDSCL